MKKKSFFIGATILAIGGFLAKILGAFYKVPLTHILGSNGMGVYYLVFPFYSLALIIASSGISIAVTKLVAVERSKYHRRNEMKILKVALLVAVLISVVLIAITLIIAEPFSFLQGNGNAYIAYVAIAPAILFASMTSVIKGYFQGVENMLPSSISLIIQQLFRLMFGLLLAYKMYDYGLQYAVLGAVLGVTISEAVSLIYLSIVYFVYKRKQFYKFFEQRKTSIRDRRRVCKEKLLEYNRPRLVNNTIKARRCCSYAQNIYFTENSDCSSTKEFFRRIIKYAIPATFSGLITPLAVFADSFLVVNLLVGSGYTTTVATSLYGMSNGIVSSLISLPIVVISAISTTIVPNLSSSIELNSRETIVTKTNFFIKFAWIIALPMFVVFLLLAPEIIDLLYSGGLSTKVIDEYLYSYRILAVSSISIVYNAFLYTFTAILNAFDRPQVPFYSQCIGLVFRTILTFALVSIPSLNVFGLLIANIVYLSISCIGCINKIKDIVSVRVNIRKFFLVPVGSIAIAGIVGCALKILCKIVFPAWVDMVIIGGTMVLVYIILLLSMRVFTAKEWAYLPIPKWLKKLLPKRWKEKVDNTKLA